MSWPASGMLTVAVALGTTGPAGAADRPAAEILREIDGLKTPAGDPDRAAIDPIYYADWRARRGAVRLRRAEAIAELYRVAPGEPRLVRLLPMRWRSLSGRLGGPDGNNEGARDLTAELDEVLAGGADPALKVEAAYIKAENAAGPAMVIAPPEDEGERDRRIEAFLKMAPKDERGAELLYRRSLGFRDDRARVRAIYGRIVAEYPATGRAEAVRGLIRKLDLVGKPFDLTFRDAIGGAEVSTRDLAGRVIVVDFWATWCAPCVAEMPRMKAIEAKYRDRGVAFLGVSLDEPEADGGLRRLRDFAAKHAISWPQYHQGGGWDAPFSRGLGIDAVPTVFLIGRDGRIASTAAGEGLEGQIERELGRGSAPDGVGPGSR